MNVSPLVILRLGCPGEPSAREISRRIRLSANAVSMFEQGRSPLSTQNMRKYAKATRSSLGEVERRWLLAKLTYHENHARRIRSQIRASGMKGKRRGKAVTTGDRE